MLRWAQKNLVAFVSFLAFVSVAIMMVGQSRVIENQRTLIEQLTSDSQQLAARKIQDVLQRHRNGK